VSVFVDSSGLFALLDGDSREHGAAADEWTRFRRDGTTLRTHSYVVIETAAIVQRRLGMDAAVTLHRDLVPVLSVRFVDRELHNEATTSLLSAARRKVSLVDWASFAVMRNEDMAEAFAFDDHFAEQGFTLRPTG
jgi:predicted nucleic acid-binding protein